MIRFLAALCILASCRGLPPQDYIKAAKDPSNGRVAVAETGGVTVSAQWKSSDHVAAERGLDPAAAAAEMAGQDLFALSFYKGDSPRAGEKGLFSDAEAVRFFSFGLEKCIRLEKNGTSWPCSFYHFERSGPGGARTALAGFESGGGGGPMKITIECAEGGYPLEAELIFEKTATLKLSL